jgi:endonuclease/exonuclease/phosphatase family metal-dependent hydrolase
MITTAIDGLFMFNAVIDTLNLREIDLSGRKFTWTNNLSNQTFEKLDRILVCTDFKSKYTHTTMHSLTGEISNHTPLLFSTNNSSATHQPQFKFELGC